MVVTRNTPFFSFTSKRVLNRQVVRGMKREAKGKNGIWYWLAKYVIETKHVAYAGYDG